MLLINLCHYSPILLLTSLVGKSYHVLFDTIPVELVSLLTDFAVDELKLEFSREGWL